MSNAPDDRTDADARQVGRDDVRRVRVDHSPDSAVGAQHLRVQRQLVGDAVSAVEFADRTLATVEVDQTDVGPSSVKARPRSRGPRQRTSSLRSSIRRLMWPRMPVARPRTANTAAGLGDQRTQAASSVLVGADVVRQARSPRIRPVRAAAPVDSARTSSRSRRWPARGGR